VNAANLAAPVFEQSENGCRRVQHLYRSIISTNKRSVMPAINVIQLPSPVVVDTEEERSEPVAACRLTEQVDRLFCLKTLDGPLMMKHVQLPANVTQFEATTATA